MALRDAIPQGKVLYTWYIKTPFSTGGEGECQDYLWVKFAVNDLVGGVYTDNRKAYPTSTGPGWVAYDPAWTPGSDASRPALMDVKQLRERAKEFIKNESNADYYPKLFEEDFGAPFGVIKYTKDHVISVQNDVDTQYQAYLDVQNELVAAYNELREECAQKYFHKGYNELEEDQQKQIQKIYPQKISEAEPKNYGN